jgi:hypothetical protein
MAQLRVIEGSGEGFIRIYSLVSVESMSNYSDLRDAYTKLLQLFQLIGHALERLSVLKQTGIKGIVEASRRKCEIRTVRQSLARATPLQEWRFLPAIVATIIERYCF